MTKLESDYKREMVKAVGKAGGFGRRIEDQFAVGVFDLLLSMPGTELVACEVKRVTGNIFHLSPRQAIEMHKIINGGGRAIAIGVSPKGMWIHGATASPRHTEIRVAKCHTPIEGEAFPQFFQRAIGEIYGRPIPAQPEPQHSGDSSPHSDVGAWEPARRGGGQLSADREAVDRLFDFGDSSS